MRAVGRESERRASTWSIHVSVAGFVVFRAGFQVSKILRTYGTHPILCCATSALTISSSCAAQPSRRPGWQK